eukprot:6198239-Pleurochrysis_carterae.AAC.1
MIENTVSAVMRYYDAAAVQQPAGRARGACPPGPSSSPGSSSQIAAAAAASLVRVVHVSTAVKHHSCDDFQEVTEPALTGHGVSGQTRVDRIAY